MFKNHIKIAWRNLISDRQFSLINLIGLTVGLAGALLIFLWVIDEIRVDRFHKKDAQLYQVMQEYPTPKGTSVVDWTPSLLAQTLVEELPEIEYATATKSGAFDNSILSYDDKHLRVNAKLASTDFFDVFSYPILEGNADNALLSKSNVLLSESTAKKLFETTEGIVGKTVNWEKKGYYDYIGTFTVAGVFQDIPTHSSENFDLILSSDYYLDFGKPGSYSWGNNPMATHVILRKGTDLETVNEKITKLIHSKNEQAENKFFIKKYSDNYLYGKYENGKQAGGRITYVRLFSIIAFIILLIASINFMNLSTARASKRLNEIGVKKTLGASRANLIGQFMSESMIFILIAFAIALIIIFAFSPSFNLLTGKELSANLDGKVLFIFLGISLFTGILAGSYPAFYLSGFQPIQVLKNNLITSFGEEWTRKGLVIFQFTISAILISAVITIYQQMDMIQSKNLGYDRDNVIHITKKVSSFSFNAPSLVM
ncbi:MAG: ABC transporter permease, partial [Bacteroidota bacterium]